MGGGSSLLVNEGDDTVSGTTPSVVSGLAVSERYIIENFVRMTRMCKDANYNQILTRTRKGWGSL